MNVLNLSTHDGGGGGKAGYRLHQNLRTLGWRSEMVVEFPVLNAEGIFALHASDLAFKVKNKARTVWSSLRYPRTNPDYYFEFESSTASSWRRLNSFFREQSFVPDVIVVHWIGNFLTLADLRRLQEITGAPIVWYMMDMGLFTGGCHYAWDCLGYQGQCGSCPALYSSKPDDFSGKNWLRKHVVLDGFDITVVAATTWLEKQVKASSLFKEKRIEKILLGIDDQIFKPVVKEETRKKLNLPLDKKIIYFGARYTEEKRKGLDYLKNALRMLRDSHHALMDACLLVTAGNEQEAAHFDGLVAHQSLGFLGEDVALARAYQAADVFVCPSIEDSGPMMINESIMCGTPVVSFDMGAAPDLVHTGKTGYRARLKSAEDLAEGLRTVLSLSPSAAQRMSHECRETGLRLCTPRTQAVFFKTLFDSLLNGRRPAMVPS